MSNQSTIIMSYLPSMSFLYLKRAGFILEHGFCIFSPAESARPFSLILLATDFSGFLIDPVAPPPSIFVSTTAHLPCAPLAAG